MEHTTNERRLTQMKIGQTSALPGTRKGILQFLSFDRLVERMTHSGIIILSLIVPTHLAEHSPGDSV
jgi:hypothetical protein